MSLRKRLESIVRGWPSGDDVIENGCIDDLLRAVMEFIKDSDIEQYDEKVLLDKIGEGE